MFEGMRLYSTIILENVKYQILIVNICSVFYGSSQYTKSIMSSSNANIQENLCSDVSFFWQMIFEIDSSLQMLNVSMYPTYFKPSFRKARDTSGSTSGGSLEIKERLTACLWLPAAEIWKHLRSCHLKYDNPRNKREAFLQRRTKINGSRWQELLWYRGK